MNRKPWLIGLKRLPYRLLMLALLLMSSFSCQAAGLDLDDIFFRSGKYYVVAGVLIIIFIAIFVFLFRLDRKISLLEKESRNED